MAEILNRLSECEEMIMKIIWSDSEGLDLSTITERAKERFDKVWKLQTVATFMIRLKQKGWINIYRIGRYSHYHPIISVEEYKRLKIQEYFDLYPQEKKEEALKNLKLYPQMDEEEKVQIAIKLTDMLLNIGC